MHRSGGDVSLRVWPRYRAVAYPSTPLEESRRPYCSTAELLLADENSVSPSIILQQHLQRWSKENPAELMELSFGESGCSVAKMSYSIPRVFSSVLLLTQALFSDGGMCRQLGSAGRVTAACLIQAQASTQLLDHVPAGTLTQTPAMLNPPGALSVEDRSRKNN
ncbi:hypothetical protein Q7C36_014145 [Tachysurus vachellii]|uniref:Uncharacterized protein n=1 Tax=Tachysurus vachellii TaxID=175792 RepID=A0AA88SEC1_TACVA|nr:hypothetical protein Q7C36_014145 [Tachysurus vachellii]